MLTYYMNVDIYKKYNVKYKKFFSIKIILIKKIFI